ncbi:hypothetical protein BSL78_11509 [Apostichopus japonicus]|uniref:Potassium channel domain-containing protein n=1 Tax=Stichopus japonicus TaxID=307972 RepID=A0A2G8KUF0_STIJA|nr:hypothetical protein BSL78_11509 [Apostichopus japonicus]
MEVVSLECRGLGFWAWDGLGYGYITPVTQLGKGLCIPYMLVGIPINVYLSANLGFFVALGITKLYTCLSNLVTGKYVVLKTKINTTISQPEVDLPTRDRGKRSSSGLSLLYINSEITQQAETSMNNDVSESEICRSSVTTSERIDLADPQDHPPPVVLDGPSTTPLWFLLLVLVSFCSLVSLMCSYIFTKWTYLDSCYFVVATFTTVGFGDMDILVREIDNQVNIWIVMVLMTVIMQIGLVVMAGTITLSAERLKNKAKRMRRLLKKKENIINSISSIIS